MTALDDYRWLIGDAAHRYLADAMASREPLHRQLARLRKDLSQQRAHLIVEQAELRARAERKFPQAAAMFFTRRGLEQASDAWVATYKAARFLPGTLIADLCCGIGGDLIALAGRGATVAVDRDPVMLLLAGENRKRLSADSPAHRFTHRAEQCEIDGLFGPSLTETAGWHIDPDRRSWGKRTIELARYEPPLEVLTRLLAINRQAAIKVAPAAAVPEDWQAECELEWISRDGECRQQVVWCGEMARNPGTRQATLLGRDGSESVEQVTGKPALPPIATELGKYLCEPDAAVLAAGLGGTLAREYSLAALGPDIVYLTADTLPPTAAVQTFAIEEVLPAERRKLKAALGHRNIGTVEVKKRGVDCDPLSLQKYLRGSGTDTATLLLTHWQGRAVALLARRCQTPGRGRSRPT